MCFGFNRIDWNVAIYFSVCLCACATSVGPSIWIQIGFVGCLGGVCFCYEVTSFLLWVFLDKVGVS